MCTNWLHALCYLGDGETRGEMTSFEILTKLRAHFILSPKVESF